MIAPTVEQFEDVKTGHAVTFSPRDAIGGPRGLRKRIRGWVHHIDTASGLAQIGDWLVPLRKVQRLGSSVWKAWSAAHRKAERKRIYGSLKRGEKGRLATCAKDARQTSLATCLGDYSGPLSKEVNAEMKICRERYMKKRGIDDFSDRGQCEALPLFLERALNAVRVPTLKGVEYVSADAGNIGVGDKITLGGQPFKFASYTPDGKAVLKGKDYEISVPLENVPRDIGSGVVSGLEKLEEKRAQRLARFAKKGARIYRRRVAKTKRPLPRRTTPKYSRHARRHRRRRRSKWCYCFGRDRRGKFRSLRRRARNPKVATGSDLFGREFAELIGDSGRAEQIPLFEREHALSPEEKAELRETARWRGRREKERSEGQLDFLQNPLGRELEEPPPAWAKWLMLLGGGWALYRIWRKHRDQND